MPTEAPVPQHPEKDQTYNAMVIKGGLPSRCTVVYVEAKSGLHSILYEGKQYQAVRISLLHKPPLFQFSV